MAALVRAGVVTGQPWSVALLLIVAAGVLVWPARSSRRRRRVLLGGVGPARSSAAGPARSSAAGPARSGRRPPGRGDIRRLFSPAGPMVGVAPRPVFPPGASPVSAPRWVLPAVGLVGCAVGSVLGGPVAGVVLAGYGVLGARALLRRGAARNAERERRSRLDQLCGLAADLRAGLPVSTLDEPADASPGDPDRLSRLTGAAVRLADRTGAPLADLLDRVEADARAADRGLGAAAAQAAGARATALLLAALPLGGIGLGYGIGADPVRVLLHTPVGAAGAITAMVLQIVGLLWVERLGRAPDGVGG